MTYEIPRWMAQALDERPPPSAPPLRCWAGQGRTDCCYPGDQVLGLCRLHAADILPDWKPATA